MRVMRVFSVGILVLFLGLGCGHNPQSVKSETPFIWEGANVYFVLIDRFNNGDPNNDVNFNRTLEADKLRGFEGGDIKGITQKIKEGYFTTLGVNAIWMTPVVEQIHGGTDEGTGLTYAFHGYWARDWTAIDPNFGSPEDLHELVEVAHNKGIRILLDAVINHTGPVTEQDPVWPKTWVRTEPTCDYTSFQSTVTCTLVDNLPDIKTESQEDVELPQWLQEKWMAEGRYEKEIQELDDFFEHTGYPRAPRFYIMKWLTDYITEFGIDGYRVDTVKHTEPYVWQEFKKVCDYAFAAYKKNHPDKVLDDNGFYLVGEVYNYGISGGKAFDFGDRTVNYFDRAFNSLINFELKYHMVQQSTEQLFKNYSEILNTDLKGFGVLNYISSHDDGEPFDASRQNPFESANKLLLSPGTSQIYYGDESARPLIIAGTRGDATLRSFMNWEAIQQDPETRDILEHWQKLGRFRRDHPAVGAGSHQMITQDPYLFYRSYQDLEYSDFVVIGMGLPPGKKVLDVSKVFEDGDQLREAYSGTAVEVEQGQVVLNTPFNLVLLEYL